MGTDAPPLVYCDVDGVLNSRRHPGRFIHADGRPHDPPRRGIAPEHLEHLHMLLLISCAEIILSSDWRHDRPADVMANLRDAGFRAFDRLVGQTPRAWPVADRTPPRSSRTEEIERDLAERGLASVLIEGVPARRKVIVLDDLPIEGPLARWHVQTSDETGLLEPHVARALALLRRG